MDDGIATPLAGSSVDPTGDTATATLAAGQLIFLTIDISNLNGDLVTDLSLTLIFQGDQVDFLGGVAIAEVLVGGPLSAPTSLGRIAHPHIKIAQPNLPGTVGDIWLQALGYAGPQPNAEVVWHSPISKPELRIPLQWP